jgi:hypothetical protein
MPPARFYLDIQDELESTEFLNTDVTIMFVDKTLRVLMGVIKDFQFALVHIHIALTL